MPNTNTVKIVLEVRDDGTIVVDKFSGNVKKAMAETQKSAKETTGGLDLMKQGWVSVTAKLALATTAFYGAKRMIYDTTREIAASTNEIKGQAEILGMSIETYQKFTYAAKMSDVGSEELSFTMKMLSRSIGDAIQGAGNARQVFEAMGISLEDLKNKRLEEILLKIADAFASWESGQRKMDYAGELLGRSSNRMIQFLNKGSAGIKGLGEEGVRLGTVLGDVVVKKGSEAENIFKRLDAQSNATRLSLAPLALEFAKTIESILGDFNKLNKWLKENKTTDWFPQLKELNQWMKENSLDQWLAKMGVYTKRFEAQEEERFQAMPTPKWIEEWVAGQKIKPPPLPAKPADALKVQEEMIQLALKYYDLDQKIAEAQDDWGSRRTHAIEMQEKLYDDFLKVKLDEIKANDQLLEDEKDKLSVLLTGVSAQEKMAREEERRAPAAAAIKKAYEDMAAEEVRMNPMFADDAYNLKMLADAAERAAHAAEMMPDWKREVADLTGDYDSMRRFQKDMLQAEMERIIRENKLTGIYKEQVEELYKIKTEEIDRQYNLKGREAVLGAQSKFGELTGDWNLMKQGEKELLQIEMERVIEENKLTGIYKDQVEQLYKLKLIEVEAERTMNIGQLVDIGGKKAIIKYNQDLVNQFENVLPNSVDVFIDSIKNSDGTFKGFFDNLQKGFDRLIQDIGYAILKMEILEALGYGKGGTSGSGGGSLWSGLLSSLFGGGGMNAGGGTGAYAYQPTYLSAGMLHTGKGPEESPSFYRLIPKFHTGIGPDEMLSIIRKDEGVFTKEQMKALAPAETKSPTVQLTILNVVDSRQIDQHLASASGQNAIINVIGSNIDTIKRFLR